MLKITSTIAFILIITLAGCKLAERLAPEDPQTIATYDFGLPQTLSPAKAGRIQARIDVPEVDAPQWLDTPAILYRLAYQDAARLQPYADSHWAAPPAALVTLRLRQALTAQTPVSGDFKVYQVQLALEEFSQVFDTPQTSRVLLRASASFSAEDGRTPLAERTFAIERSAPSPDAVGAVSALTAASDELITQVSDWLASLPGVQ